MGAVVSNDIHSAIMARQGSRPQGIGYCDRKVVLGARAIFIEVQCNFAEFCKKKQDKQLDLRDTAKSRENPAKPGTVGKSVLKQQQMCIKGGVVATVHMRMKLPFPNPGSATGPSGSTSNVLTQG